MGLLTRKEGMSVADFQRYWRDIHGPLVVAELTGMRRYVQSHALPETYARPTPPAWDGIAKAWFDSLEAYPPGLGLRREVPPRSAATRDTASFIKQPIPSLVVREVIILD